jgi:hypothetical protein
MNGSNFWDNFKFYEYTRNGRARRELENALKISRNHANNKPYFDLLFSAYIQLFEVEIEDGSQLWQRYKKAIGEILPLPFELTKNEEYKIRGLKQLLKAKKTIQIESDHLEMLMGIRTNNQIISENEISPLSKMLKNFIQPKQVYQNNCFFDLKSISEPKYKEVCKDLQELEESNLQDNSELKKCREKLSEIKLSNDWNDSLSDLHNSLLSYLEHLNAKLLNEEADAPFLKHIQSKYYCLKVYTGNIESLIEQLNPNYIVYSLMQKYLKTKPGLYESIKKYEAKRKSKNDQQMSNDFLFLSYIQLLKNGIQCETNSQNTFEILPFNEKNMHEINEEYVFKKLNECIEAIKNELTFIDNLLGQIEQNETQKDNSFLKHIESRKLNLNEFLDQMNVESLKKQINEFKIAEKTSGIWVGTKKTRYLSELDSNLSHEKSLKEAITTREVNELEWIGTNAIYQLGRCYDVPSEMLTSAKWQIYSGMGILASSIIFPPSAFVTVPIANLLITEGLTDVFMALINSTQSGFNKKSYVMGKVVSYGLGILTMGFSAIMKSEKILNKILNTVTKLADKLRAVEGPFASICRTLASWLDKFAVYLKEAIDKIKFIKMTLDERQTFLKSLLSETEKANYLKLAQNNPAATLGASTAATSLTMDQFKAAFVEQFQVIIKNSLKSTARSILIDKSVSFTLDLILNDLKPHIKNKVVTRVKEKFNIPSNLKRLKKYSKRELLQVISELNETSLSEEVLNVIQQISFGLANQCKNWKVQLTSLVIDTIFSSVDMARCTNKICDKYLEILGNYEASSFDPINDEDFQIILETLSETISSIFYSNIIALSSKWVKALPKIFIQRNEERKERKELKSIEDRLKEITSQDSKADINNNVCAPEGVANMFGVDRDDVAQSSNIAASEEGTSIETTKKMLSNMNVESFVQEDGIDIGDSLKENQSDRYLMFYTDKNGNNHAVNCSSKGNFKIQAKIF